MGVTYSTQTIQLPDPQNDENSIEETEIIEDKKQVEISYDPFEIFHPSAFENITTEMYSKIVKYHNNNKYIYCTSCNHLSNFSSFTKKGRAIAPTKDSIRVIKEDDIYKLYIKCNKCKNVIENSDILNLKG
mgnify:CR=1 FL=1|tara:strand:+ start:350 stop:742 length:393 start_codon:yes stop_codon:yes gene_type:complete